MEHNKDGNHEETPSALMQRLGLPFKNTLLLTRALTHRSYVNEHPDSLEDNERLEFLGDAVLDFLVGAWLYNRFPEMAEGELTRMRSSLVRTEQLAEFARGMDLGVAIRLGRGEDQAGGRRKDVLLCATFEAVIAALYLQTDIKTIQDIIHPLLENTSKQLLQLVDFLDPKSRLQEWSQMQELGIPRYKTVKTSGPDNERLFEVEVEIGDRIYGRGVGRTKQLAEFSAAQNTLDIIRRN
jgi:ribonuclease-3